MPVIAVLLMVSLIYRNISSQQCGIDHDTYSIYQMMLSGHTFKKFQVRPLSNDCREVCKSDVRCQSYNYAFLKDICELNNRTKEARAEDFIESSDRYYMKKASNRGKVTYRRCYTSFLKGLRDGDFAVVGKLTHENHYL